MRDMETVRMCDAARELCVLPQHIYGYLWSGKLAGKQDPETGAWTIRRGDLEEFKQQRIKARGNGRRKKNLKTREVIPA